MNSLSHLTVLELASVLAGPSVGQFFAEQGARVIKLENPVSGGDVTRTWRLPERRHNSSVYFHACNWGKESVAVNLKTADGREILHGLAARSDIVLQSFIPGHAARLGADYDSLRQANERLIFGEVTGYGSQSSRPGYDAIIQAEAGYYYLNREPGELPAKMPVALVDVLAAHQLKTGLLLALLERENTGRGKRVSVSLFDAAVSGLVNQATAYLAGRTVPEPLGSDHPVIAPYGSVYKTKDDRSVVLAVGTDRQFSRLCSLLNIPELANDTRYCSNQRRVANRETLKVTLQSAVARFERNDLLNRCRARSIPAGAVRRMDEVFADPPHTVLIPATSQAAAGLRQYVGSPTADRQEHLSAPPTYGSSTRHVLESDLSYTAEEVQRLIDENIVETGRSN